MTLLLRAKTYVVNICRAVDRLANAIAGGNPAQSVSARAYPALLRKKRWACVLCRLLGYLQADHCLLAWEAELQEARRLVASQEV